MAPELFSATGQHSRASDLWALGCLLYECAAGQPPFASASHKELVQSILHQAPPPLAGGISSGVHVTTGG